MNDSCAWDAVAIDTNVFEHLFNDCENPDKHINNLLESLQKNNTKLLVDNKSRITKEYHIRISPRLNNPEKLNESHVLRYWLANQETQKKIDVDEPSDLMNAIKEVVHEPNSNEDRTFIYVAFCQGKNLISNDHVHIVAGPKTEKKPGERRHRLKQSARKTCKASRQSNIFTSLEAHTEIKTSL